MPIDNLNGMHVNAYSDLVYLVVENRSDWLLTFIHQLLFFL